MKRLQRSRKEKVLAGVCGGIGEYYQIDPVIVRLAAVLLTLFGGITLLAYIVMIFAVPLAPLQTTADQKSGEGEKPVLSRADELKAKEEQKTRMREHVRILGFLYIGLSALGIIAAVIVFILLNGTGYITGDKELIMILHITGIVVAAILVFFSLPGIFAGLGLLKFESWARILALILGVLQLINIPFGTILGVYTIWVLSRPETVELFK